MLCFHSFLSIFDVKVFYENKNYDFQSFSNPHAQSLNDEATQKGPQCPYQEHNVATKNGQGGS